MPYIQQKNREQMMLTSLDMMVDSQSMVRVIDVFVDSLDLKDMGFTKAAPSSEGRPAYCPQALLKLYIFGYQHSIRSSRKLAYACKSNIEVMWLLGALMPDFRTIADFRKNNASALKEVFNEFNNRILAGRELGFQSVDGTKIRANNAKDANFTANKLDDRIQWLTNHCEDYLRRLEEEDEAENKGELSREELEAKLHEAQTRLLRYEGYREQMEQTGASQLSLTDADAKLMKAKNGFEVSYNIQTAIDSNTHIMTDFAVTNQPTDHGLLHSTLDNVHSQTTDNILEATADKGYICTQDMAQCLEEGIVPHVVLPDGKDSFELEFDYVESDEINELSTNPEDISACLQAGVIPKSYRDVIGSVTFKNKRVLIKDDNETPSKPYGSEKNMLERAQKGYFVRDPESNVVVCPHGEKLRQKAVKSNEKIRYANKLACKRCPHKERCFSGNGKWKEIDFSKDELEKPSRLWNKNNKSENKSNDTHKKKRRYLTKKIVSVSFYPNRKITDMRKCLSEHPFGTIKRSLGGTYFLVRGKQKVEGEFALLALAYNMKRAMEMMSFEELIEAVTKESFSVFSCFIFCIKNIQKGFNNLSKTL